MDLVLEAILVLAKLLEHGTDDERMCAMGAMGALFDHRALPYLVEALSDPVIRFSAVYVLTHLATVEYKDVLLGLLTDPEYATVVYTIQAVERLKLKEAIPYLKTLLAHEDNDIQDYARTAIKNIAC